MDKDVFRSRLAERVKAKKEQKKIKNKYLFDIQMNEIFKIGPVGILSVVSLIILLIAYSIKIKVNIDVYIMIIFVSILIFSILRLLEKETERAREIFKYD